MYSKTKLLEVYEKIKAHSEQNNNAELAALANELYAEIQAMDATNDSDSGGGSNNPPPPNIP